MSDPTSLLNEICDIVWTSNAAGEIVEPQPSWSAFTGLDYAQTAGLGWTTAIHIDDRKKILSTWQEAIDNASIFRINARVFHAESQSHRLVQSTATPELDDDQQLIGWKGGMIDIEDKSKQLSVVTAQSKVMKKIIAERNQEVENQQHLLEKLIGSTSLILIMIDAEGRYSYINDKADELISFKREEMLGEHWQKIPLPSESKTHIKRLIQQLSEEKKSLAEKMWLPTAGRLRLYTFTLNPILDDNEAFAGVVIAGEDITESDAAEQVIRSSEERLRLLTDALPVLISYVDQEHRYLYNNPQYSLAFNKPLDQITNKYVWEVIGEEAYAASKDRIDRALAGEEQHYDVDMVDPLGVRHFMQVTYIPHREKNEVIGFFAMINDLTHVKNVEQKNREQERELAHLHRISSLGEMASNLAHELNQPLTAIANYASVSRRLLAMESHCDLEHEADIKKALDGVEKQSHRAADIIRKVRTFIRKRAVEFCSLSMNQLVEETMDFIGFNLREKDVHVRFEPSKLNTDIKGDAIQLQQIITNLLVNAAEVTRQPDSESTMAYIDVKVCRLKDQSIKLTVRDYGPKLAQDELERIFEPFFTTKSEGMGMGLAISSSIAEAHGGRIEGTANDDCGVTMSLTLPAVEPHPTI